MYNSIPHTILQTDKKYPEKYVIDMMRSYIGDWNYDFFDDQGVIKFFEANPIDDMPDIIARYNAIEKGAHRADLFRYYYLYLKGGVFLDSDAMFCVNINHIVKDYEFITSSSNVPNTVFQGLLGTTPRNPIIKEALYNAYNTDPATLKKDYFFYCRDLYNIIQKNKNVCKIKIYTEALAPDKLHAYQYDDETGVVVSRHYYYAKVIPPNHMPDQSHYQQNNRPFTMLMILILLSIIFFVIYLLIRSYNRKNIFGV